MALAVLLLNNQKICTRGRSYYTVTSMGVMYRLPHPLDDNESHESTDWLSSDLSPSFCHDPELSSDMDDRHVLDDGADELHDANVEEQLSVDNELFLFECLRKCLARWSLLMNFLSQFEQVNFFSPVCVRRWRERSSDLANRLLQDSQSQTNGFSPVCVLR